MYNGPKNLDTKKPSLKCITSMRKNYPPSFKAQVVLEILKEEKTISQMLAEHGIHPKQLIR